MEQPNLQNKLDIEKWLDSETKRKDQCGRYAYCAYCENEPEYPCANAYLRYRDANAETAPDTTAENEAAAARVAVVRKPSLSFAEKLALASEDTKAAYAEIVAAMELIDCVRGRVTKSAHNFNVKRVPVAKIRIQKRGLRLFLALDPTAKKYEKIPHKDVTEKKSYARIPFDFKVSSPLSLRRAHKLIADLAAISDHR